MDIVLAISALNGLISLVGNATTQMQKVGAIVDRAQKNDGVIPEHEWETLDNALETARNYAKTAQPAHKEV